MRFLTIFRPAGTISEGAAGGPRPAAMRTFTEEKTKAGVLISQAMLNGSVTHVRFDGDEFSVAQTSESIAGYAFIEAASTEEAIEGAKEFLRVAGAGATEVRQVLA